MQAGLRNMLSTQPRPPKPWELKRLEPKWYVLRDLSRPNNKRPAYRLLLNMPEIKPFVFVPIKQQIFYLYGRRIVRTIPFMTDLIFVHKSRAELDPLVRKIELLQYRYVRGGQHYEPMTVNPEAMQAFIKAVLRCDNPEYYSLKEVSPQLYGKRIRIIGGRLDGLEGRLMSKRGSKTKRILVDLEECNLSAAIEVEAEYIQLVGNKLKSL